MTDVTVKELTEQRAQLNADILKSISEKVNKFIEETGVNVTSIDVSMHASQSIGEPIRYFVGGVMVTVELPDPGAGL